MYTQMWHDIKFPESQMTRAIKKSAKYINTSVYQENLSSNHETEMQVLEQQPSTSQAQFVPPMYMHT